MTRKTIISGGLFLVLGAVLGVSVMSFVGGDGLPGDNAAPTREIAYWVAPMDPNFRREAPGKSPMGMDLVPVYTDEAGAKAGYDGVEIDPRIVANIGVETAVVTRETKAPIIHTVAHVAYNEKDTAHVHVRANGWVEKLHVRAAGETVEAGEPLFDVYSPELNTAQAEYLQAFASQRTGLIRSAEERLIGLGLSKEDIAGLKASKQARPTMTVRAPIKGVVTTFNVSDQARIMSDRPALTLVDLDTVWLLADVFEADIPHVRKGANVKVFDVNTEKQVASSVVDYIYPDLNMQTRTNPVRVVLANKDNQFRPGQFYKVDIERGRLNDALFVPSTAIIRLGDGNRVILAEGEGKFRPAEVLIGESVGEYTEIKAGLYEGERVVVGSQFLIDSESSFQGARVRLTSDDPVMETEVFARGQIVHLNPSNRMLTFSHLDVPDYDWDAGEKTLSISSVVALDTLDTGMKVHIGLATKSDGSIIVTALTPIGEGQ